MTYEDQCTASSSEAIKLFGFKVILSALRYDILAPTIIHLYFCM
jgi:hypothetical protein